MTDRQPILLSKSVAELCRLAVARSSLDLWLSALRQVGFEEQAHRCVRNIEPVLSHLCDASRICLLVRNFERRVLKLFRRLRVSPEVLSGCASK